MTSIRFTLATVLLVAATSCSSASTPGATQDPSPSADRGVSRNPSIITSEELQDPAIASQDALTAIRQLRPSYFRTRGPMTMRSGGDPNAAPGQVQMSQDFGPLHPLSELGSVSVRTLVEVRYLDANESQARFGINANGGPVIVVLTSKQ